MRQTCGIILVIASIIVTALLFATGNMGDEKVVDMHSGEIGFFGWNVVVVGGDYNWSLAIPLLICFVVGVLCLIVQTKKSNESDAGKNP